MKKIIQSLIDKIQSRAGVKKVYGDPILVGKKTIIPVSRVAYGFGGGVDPTGSIHLNDDEPFTQNNAGFGGIGGGVYLQPEGVLEITDEKTNYISFYNRKRIIGAVVGGFLLGYAAKKWLK